MVAIRQIIAVGCLLSLVGCGTRYAYVGDWVGTIELTPGPPTPADETLKTVKLNVNDDGKFVLIVKSIPMEGRLDFFAKTQQLNFDYVLGKSVDRLGPGATPNYSITWNGDHSISLSGAGGLSVSLHRKPKPLAS